MAGTPNIPGSQKHQGWLEQWEVPLENGLVKASEACTSVQEQGVAPNRWRKATPIYSRDYVYISGWRNVNTPKHPRQSLQRAALQRAALQPAALQPAFQAPLTRCACKPFTGALGFPQPWLKYWAPPPRRGGTVGGEKHLRLSSAAARSEHGRDDKIQDRLHAEGDVVMYLRWGNDDTTGLGLPTKRNQTGSASTIIHYAQKTKTAQRPIYFHLPNMFLLSALQGLAKKSRCSTEPNKPPNFKNTKSQNLLASFLHSLLATFVEAEKFPC